MTVANIEYRPGGIGVIFTNGVSATAEYVLIDGQLTLTGLTNDQIADIQAFNNNMDNSIDLDPRFGVDSYDNILELVQDTSPQLGGTLNLGGHSIYNGTISGRGNRVVELQLTRNDDSQIATGEYSFIAGCFNTANGYASFAVNENNIAYGDYSSAFGLQSLTYLTGQQSLSGGCFLTIGDSQYTRTVLYAESTDTNYTTLNCYASAGEVHGLALRIFAIGQSTHASFHRQLLISNYNDELRIIDQATIGDINPGTYSLRFRTDINNLMIDVKNSSGEITRWLCYIDSVETGMSFDIPADTIGTDEEVNTDGLGGATDTGCSNIVRMTLSGMSCSEFNGTYNIPIFADSCDSDICAYNLEFYDDNYGHYSFYVNASAERIYAVLIFDDGPIEQQGTVFWVVESTATNPFECPFTGEYNLEHVPIEPPICDGIGSTCIIEFLNQTVYTSEITAIFYEFYNNNVMYPWIEAADSHYIGVVPFSQLLPTCYDYRAIVVIPLEIPQGATVVIAKLTLFTDSPYTISASLAIELIDADNVPLDIDSPDVITSDKTMLIPWNAVNDEGFITSDFTQAVNQIINRENWEPGNNIGIIVRHRTGIPPSFSAYGRTYYNSDIITVNRTMPVLDIKWIIQE